MNRRIYGLLLVLTIVATVGGLLTLIPWPAASYPNVLGYRSLCTFAPAATFFCFAIAGTSCVLRASAVKRRAAAGKTVVHAGAVAVVALLFVAAIGFSIRFGAVKRTYTDGDAGATVATANRDTGR